MNPLTPQEFGARGNGVTDDTEALRAWASEICGGHGYVPRGRYPYSGSWSIFSESRIDGAGAGVSVFQSVNSTAGICNARPRWTTAVDPENGGAPLDRDIFVSNVCFAGQSDAAIPQGGSPIAFVGVDRIKFRDCLFKGFRSDLIVLHNITRADFDAVEMTDWGRLEHHGPVGHYVGGCAIFAWHGVERVRMTNCDIHDGAGGLWLQDVPETILLGTRINNTCEFDVVGVGKRSAWAVNIFGACQRLDVSGHNAELHGEEFIYALNVHADAAGSNVYASNLRNVLLPGNLCLRPGPDQAGITLASHGLWAGVGDHPPECVSIEANLFCDQNKQAAHAVLVTDQDGGPVKDVRVANNNTGNAKQWHVKPVQTERKGVTLLHN